MEAIKILRRLQQVQVKLESARRVLQDGKEIPCDRKLMGIQQIVAQFMADIASEATTGVIADDPADSAEDEALEQSATEPD